MIPPSTHSPQPHPETSPLSPAERTPIFLWRARQGDARTAPAERKGKKDKSYQTKTKKCCEGREMDNNLDCQCFGHSLHRAMMIDMAEKMHAKASFESVNVSGCPNIMRYFIPQSAPSLCETSVAVKWS